MKRHFSATLPGPGKWLPLPLGPSYGSFIQAFGDLEGDPRRPDEGAGDPGEDFGFVGLL